MYEYLPALLGEKIPNYNGYNPDLHPGISHVFQSAAFRFGHTMIPPGIYRRDEKCKFKTTKTGHIAIRLCMTWWDSNVSNYFTCFLHYHCYKRDRSNTIFLVIGKTLSCKGIMNKYVNKV